MGDIDGTYDLEKALSLAASHFPEVPLGAVSELARKIEFAADLRKAGVPVDTRNAERLDDIERIEKSLTELNRLFAAGYPDVMEDFRQMVWRELRLASVAKGMKKFFGPHDYVLVEALVGVYRDGSGKEPPATIVDRVTGETAPNEFTKFVLAVFGALCDGQPPSLDTIGRAVERMAAKD